MERDKRGRFVKKAQLGTKVPKTVSLNGKPPFVVPKVPDLDLSTVGLNARADHINALNNQNAFGRTG
jgi:hypothetical protein